MLLNFADIALANKGNLYFELYNNIKDAVAEGVLKKGEKLPSVREAASQLGISRTTVENAYTRLCIEGIAESLPQRGYYIIGMPKAKAPAIKSEEEEKKKILFDFSSRLVDATASDTQVWKKLLRSVLWDTDELNSYGDPQGELCLREALADYSYKSRGVITNAENIVIGAGMGPLLNILCGLIDKNITVGFENSEFLAAERIFSDYGIKACRLCSDQNGATKQALWESNSDILFLQPSALGKISPTALSQRRNIFYDWVKNKGRLIIEDDYNGELRYFARSVPAFQPKAPDSTVYIGSFSKLLLPSVRIAYMVLPDFLAERFKGLSNIYNQTCGKIEQLTLEKYIVTGALEKHLKRLRRLYYTKSQLLIKELENGLDGFKSATLFESSLTVEVALTHPINGINFIKKCGENGIKIPPLKNNSSLRLSFGGIATEEIAQGIKLINKILKNL